VDFELILFDKTHFHEKLANVFALITLKLKNFAILGMFNYSSIASELLIKKTFSLVFY
jgi:hypothetical protein